MENADFFGRILCSDVLHPSQIRRAHLNEPFLFRAEQVQRKKTKRPRRNDGGMNLKKKILIILLGAVGGFAYYYFVGCYNGSCLIQSNPYLSTLYGASLGWAAAGLIIPVKKYDSDSDPIKK